MGNAVFDRFGTLWLARPGGARPVSNRGGFVGRRFTRDDLGECRSGYGLGWWGMVNVMFAIPSKPTTVWVEVMLAGWLIDGGIPLLIGYGGAVTDRALSLGADRAERARTAMWRSGRRWSWRRT